MPGTIALEAHNDDATTETAGMTGRAGNGGGEAMEG
jgi:hypothetical protein